MPQEPNATTTESIPLWRDERVFKIAIQVAVLVALAIAIGILSRNFVVNYSRLNLQFGFGFLDRPPLALATPQFPTNPPIHTAVPFSLAS